MSWILTIIVNENDEIINHKPRTEIQQTEIYRVSALRITNSKGEILLAQRALTKRHDPGIWWAAVAGTNDEWETYESNIIKEAEEEIGLKNFTYKKATKLKCNWEHNFFCQRFTTTIDKEIEEFILQQEEVAQIKRFTPKELEIQLDKHPEKFLTHMKKEFLLFQIK